MPDELDLAQDVVRRARLAGADHAEATYVTADRFSAEARDAQITKLQQSVGRSLSVRIFAGGGKSSLSTTDLSAAGVDALLREAVAAASFVAEDPFAGLPERTGTPVANEGLEIFSADVRAYDPERKLEDARTLEREIRAFDERITNSAGSHVGDTVLTLGLANTCGFAGTYAQTSASRGSGPIAQDGKDKRVAHYGSAARGYAALEPTATVAKIAAGRAVGMCGARKPPTMRVPVIFERDVAAAVLSDVFASCSAANVAVGNSFLMEKVGERIGSDLVTILDDGLLPRGLGTSPFDAEGTPTRRTTVFERGVLRTYLYDAYYGRKLGASSTGNASGGGIGPNNFYLLPGEKTLEEIVAATPRGVVVLDVIGFATESVTGTYSRGARGFYVENGEIAYPIDEFTIASNLATMLGAIDLVGSDLRFDGSIVAPSFRVAEMTVSGA